MKTARYCIFHDAPDKEPSWHDGDTNLPITYATKREAELEILSTIEDHIAQIKAGEREFDDGIGFNDWIEAVDVDEHGTVFCEDGTQFGARS
jgi:hypothetical protein